MNGLPAMPELWQEAKTPEGRVYYYNTQTKATQWTKPVDMMSPAERAVSQSPWKEYTHDGGRKYWHNTETNKTTWEMPDVYKNAQAQQLQPPATPVAQAMPSTFVAGGGNNFQDSYRPRDRDYDRDERHGLERGNNDRMSGYGPMDGVRSSVISSQADPEYSTFEEAESAFHKLLRRVGVQPEWTWEHAVRAAVKDPQYRAIKDPKDRKIAFEKYQFEVRAQEKDREKERQAKLRADFNNMLRSHPEITHYTRWTTARSIIERETIFRSARSEEERQSLFNEYRAELLKAHNEDDSRNRRAALDKLVHLLQSLDLEPYTRWSEAQSALKADERFQGDEQFQSLSKIDVLKAFESHIKALERSFNDTRQKQKTFKARQERQNRDQFISLLKDLRSAGKIKAGAKWSDIHELIEDDPRYVSMLGQAGSTPLDLFWDMVEEEERMLRGKRNDVLDVLQEKRYELTQKTPFDEFVSVMQTDRRTASIDPEYLRLIFDRLHDRVLRRSDDEKHAQRRAVDSLRSKIKRLEPPVAASDTWEQVRPRIEKLEEYRALDSDDLRKQAFDKVVKRLKESKDRDDEHDRDHYHGVRRDRERERERPRDVDYRNGGRGDSHRPRHRTGTRTPEIDAYEADRKKAIADRERQYRKSSVSGLSPPPPRRDRDDRYDRGRDRERERERERDRFDGRPRSRHDRPERRDREGDREKSYISRADPREKGSELDYGESRPSSIRRRRDSEGETRDSKRVRRDATPREPTHSHSPRTAAAPAKEPDVEYKSGSEEGELLDD